LAKDNCQKYVELTKAREAKSPIPLPIRAPSLIKSKKLVQPGVSWADFLHYYQCLVQVI